MENSQEETEGVGGNTVNDVEDSLQIEDKDKDKDEAADGGGAIVPLFIVLRMQR